jgi:hypothetical protein
MFFEEKEDVNKKDVARVQNVVGIHISNIN